jgi:hypothetical protein
MAKSNTDTKIDQIDKFHKTRKGRITFGLAELVVAYLFISLAINSGQMWQYLIAVILVVGAINNLIRSFSVRGVKPGGKKPAKKR